MPRPGLEPGHHDFGAAREQVLREIERRLTVGQRLASMSSRERLADSRRRTALPGAAPLGGSTEAIRSIPRSPLI